MEKLYLMNLTPHLFLPSTAMLPNLFEILIIVIYPDDNEALRICVASFTFILLTKVESHFSGTKGGMK